MAGYGTQYGPRDYGFESRINTVAQDTNTVSQSRHAHRYGKKDDWFEIRGKYFQKSIHGCPYNAQFLYNNFQTGSERAYAFLERFDSIDYKESVFAFSSSYDDPENPYAYYLHYVNRADAEWSDEYPESTNIYIGGTRPSGIVVGGSGYYEFDFTPTSSVWCAQVPVLLYTNHTLGAYTPADVYPPNSDPPYTVDGATYTSSYAQVTYNGARGLTQYSVGFGEAEGLLTDSYFSSSTLATQDGLPWISNTYGVTSRFRYDEYGYGPEQTIFDVNLDTVKAYTPPTYTAGWHDFDPELIVNITGSGTTPNGIVNLINPFRSFHSIQTAITSPYGGWPISIRSYGSQCKFFGPYVVVDYYYFADSLSPYNAAVAIIREEGFLSGRPNDITSPYIHIGWPDSSLLLTEATFGTGINQVGRNHNYAGHTVTAGDTVLITCAERRVYRNESIQTITEKLAINSSGLL